MTSIGVSDELIDNHRPGMPTVWLNLISLQNPIHGLLNHVPTWFTKPCRVFADYGQLQLDTLTDRQPMKVPENWSDVVSSIIM